MDLATFWGTNDTNGCHLAVFSKNVALTHFVALHPSGVLVVLATPVKNLPKMACHAAIVAIHSIVGA